MNSTVSVAYTYTDAFVADLSAIVTSFKFSTMVFSSPDQIFSVLNKTTHSQHTEFHCGTVSELRLWLVVDPVMNLMSS